MASWLAAAVLMMSSVATASGAQPGAVFRSQISGFTINAPPAWVRLSGSELGQQTALRTSKGRPGVEFAFQPASAGRSLAYPYAIVTVVPYSAFGLTRQVTPEEMQQIAREIGDRKPTPGAAAAQPGIPEAGARPVFDVSKNSALMSYAVDVPKVGRVESRSACFFGREAMVQVTFSAKAGTAAAHAAACDQLFASFRFDPEQEFVQSMAAGIVPEEESVLAGGVPQAAALGGVGLAFLLYAVAKCRGGVAIAEPVDAQPAMDGEEY
jgi:hypothetical protein